MTRLALCLLLTGCNQLLGIEEEHPRAADASPPTGVPDAAPDAPRTVAHLAAEASWPGEGDVTFTTAAGIDTTTLEVDGGLPAGVSFDAWPQLADGSEVAVLHVASLTIAPDVVVAVTGARPLVVVSRGDIAVGGTLDAGAHATLAGPGASPAGAGGVGLHAGSYLDGGGGGAGHGEGGGDGGEARYAGTTACSGTSVGALATAGTAGDGDDDAALEWLVGGAAGGAGGSSCPSQGLGGAGGGALQLSSFTRISVAGLVRAGGGGGRGGSNCGPMDASAGGGGGAGGSIYLEAPEVSVLASGAITANGGGGGSGGSSNQVGMPGADGGADASPAAGGPGVAQFGGAGATGGAREVAPGSAQAAPDCGNGGGGGGAVGRVVVKGGVFVETGVVSPAALRPDAP
jgi:hypothetical protein